MAHDSESTWAITSDQTATTTTNVLSSVAQAEERYQDLLETFTWSGGTTTTFANLLFHGDPTLTIATAEEIQKTTDLVAAMTAVHDISQALNNVALPAANRAQDMRRMSN